MISRSLRNCSVELVLRWHQVLKKCAAINIELMITGTSRTPQDHLALWMQGRESLDKVNAQRKICGMAPITEKENEKKRTWTMNSKHIVTPDHPLSDAIDFVIMRNGKPIWNDNVDANDNNIPDYIEVAKIAEECGLKAGAFFLDEKGKPRPDYCHIEI